MRDDFYNIYKERLNSKYRSHVNYKYNEFFHAILENLFKSRQDNLSIAEYGCGAANISRQLSIDVPEIHHTLIDIDSRMLMLSVKNMMEVTQNFEIMNLDIINEIPDKKFGLIHSHGVLEHFDNKQIRQIIKNQLKVSDIVIHYVPTSKYKTPSFGDERLLSPFIWQKIANPDKIIRFNNGYDLILLWDRRI